MIPVGERDASVVRKRAKSGAIIAALGAICGLEPLLLVLCLVQSPGLPVL